MTDAQAIRNDLQGRRLAVPNEGSERPGVCCASVTQRASGGQVSNGEASKTEYVMHVSLGRCRLASSAGRRQCWWLCGKLQWAADEKV